MNPRLARRFSTTPYLFLVPALALIGVFVLYPIISVIYYSFTEYDISRPPVWIGLENYQNLVVDPTFWLALTHSIVYLLVTPILIVLSMGSRSSSTADSAESTSSGRSITCPPSVAASRSASPGAGCSTRTA
jgi:ABC-type sugar transport system permease subunit